jgi:enamine deaminase RidA (YjgF/YER057c/UK114 family)
MSDRHRISSGSPFESTIGFSRALRVDDRVWVSGTGPVWLDGTCPEDVGQQARRCFDIIVAALGEAGARTEDVVRTRMFLTSVDDADAVSAVHGEIFASIRPAATMVVVAALLDPRWKIEIEVDALIGSTR